MTYKDGEVIGIDTDGCLVLWNADDEELYNCGETLEEFGELTAIELARIKAVTA